VESYFNSGIQIFSVDREEKHRLGHLVALTGFLMVPLGGIGYSFLEVNEFAGVASAVTGFLVFLLGAELAFRTKEDSTSEDS
jgi:hypothetical protein